MSSVTMRAMLEAGVHFGHQSRYWNPRMADYIFCQRNKIHIINLEKSLPMYNDALNFVGNLAAKKGTLMFVGTKRSAQNIIQEEAIRCDMPFVNRRWLGGLLTNYRTVKQSIKRMQDLADLSKNGLLERLNKREQLQHQRELNKLERGLAGIKNMEGLPDALFIVDVGYESLAVSEAKKLGIPVIGVVDSNSNPENIDYIIPGNDDAMSSIRLYASGIADAILDGHAVISNMHAEKEGFVEIDVLGQPIINPTPEKSSSTKIRKKTKFTEALDKPTAKEVELVDTEAKTMDVAEQNAETKTMDVAEQSAETKTMDVAEQSAETKTMDVAEQNAETKTMDVAGQSAETSDTVLHILKQPEKPYRANSARIKYWERLQQFDKKPIAMLQKSIDAEPPSQPISGKLVGKTEPLTIWLNFFAKAGLIKIESIMPEEKGSNIKISATTVREMRERTGAGMMDCKKALKATHGDIEKAIEDMRKSGLAKAIKKAGRVATEGLVVVKQNKESAKILVAEVNSETDFVAKDTNFRKFCDDLADCILANEPKDINALMECTVADSGQTLEEQRQQLITKIDENISVRRFMLLGSAGNTLASYLHGVRIGVIIELTGGDEALAKDIAMHIAASNPICISEADMPQDVVAKEKEIFMAQAKESGKPDDIIKKIVAGRTQKFLQENTLLGQPFVKDTEQTIAQLLKAAGATVLHYFRYEVGEGLEKKDSKFVEEVMAQAKST